MGSGNLSLFHFSAGIMNILSGLGTELLVSLSSAAVWLKSLLSHGCMGTFRVYII